MVTKDEYNPQGHIGQRAAAELLNSLVFNGYWSSKYKSLIKDEYII